MTKFNNPSLKKKNVQQKAIANTLHKRDKMERYGRIIEVNRAIIDRLAETHPDIEKRLFAYMDKILRYGLSPVLKQVLKDSREGVISNENDDTEFKIDAIKNTLSKPAPQPISSPKTYDVKDFIRTPDTKPIVVNNSSTSNKLPSSPPNKSVSQSYDISPDTAYLIKSSTKYAINALLKQINSQKKANQPSDIDDEDTYDYELKRGKRLIKHNLYEYPNLKDYVHNNKSMVENYGVSTAVRTYKKEEDKTFERRIKKAEDRINAMSQKYPEFVDELYKNRELIEKISVGGFITKFREDKRERDKSPELSAYEKEIKSVNKYLRRKQAENPSLDIKGDLDKRKDYVVKVTAKYAIDEFIREQNKKPVSVYNDEIKRGSQKLKNYSLKYPDMMQHVQDNKPLVEKHGIQAVITQFLDIKREERSKKLKEEKRKETIDELTLKINTVKDNLVKLTTLNKSFVEKYITRNKKERRVENRISDKLDDIKSKPEIEQVALLQQIHKTLQQEVKITEKQLRKKNIKFGEDREVEEEKFFNARDRKAKRQRAWNDTKDFYKGEIEGGKITAIAGGLVGALTGGPIGAIIGTLIGRFAGQMVMTILRRLGAWIVKLAGRALMGIGRLLGSKIKDVVMKSLGRSALTTGVKTAGSAVAGSTVAGAGVRGAIGAGARTLGGMGLRGALLGGGRLLGMGAGLLSGPVGWGILGATALGAGGYYLYKKKQERDANQEKTSKEVTKKRLSEVKKESERLAKKFDFTDVVKPDVEKRSAKNVDSMVTKMTNVQNTSVTSSPSNVSNVTSTNPNLSSSVININGVDFSSQKIKKSLSGRN